MYFDKEVFRDFEDVDFIVIDGQWCTEPYLEAIGSIFYLMVDTRPYLAYVVCTLSKYVANPGPIHWNSVRRVLIYIILSNKAGIYYVNG